MSIIQSLSSWIAYAVAGAFFTEVEAAILAALVACSVVLLALRRGRSVSELVVEGASATFFVGYAIAAWMMPTPRELAQWVGPLSQFWLAAAVLLGLALHQPFTLPIARRNAPLELHATDRFYAFNVRLSRAWLISFVTSGLVLTVAAYLHQTHIWLNIACIAAAIIAPTMYTRRLVLNFQHASKAV